MHNSIKQFALFLLLTSALLGACKKEQTIVFGVNNVGISEDKSNKIKKKNGAEYISILYTNLYQKAISPNQLYKTQNVLYSIGDQDVANEMLLSNYFNTGSIIMPSNAIMRSDIDAFVVNTFKRFYLRYPSEGEKAFLKQYISKSNAVSVEMVYTAFATSKEYQYY